MPVADHSCREGIYYFVDEAGTPTLFRRRRQNIVGQPGCSNYFILGKLEVDEPQILWQRLDELRAELLADPYFRGVPSMQPNKKKTALLFHAKDDLPEVRYRILKLLARQAVSFYAVVRDKHRVVDEVLARNQADVGYWYRENDLYDELVAHLFKSRFHRAEHFEIYFARRGKSDRTEALKVALEQARRTYEIDKGTQREASISIRAGASRDIVGLQAVDYFLWALQRLYEKNEDRYWETISSRVQFVYDRDDVREAAHGVFYTPERPLTKANRAKK